MIEDNYEIFFRDGDYFDLIASNMSIDNAVLFVIAWFQKHYNEEHASLEIKRQPVERE